MNSRQLADQVERIASEAATAACFRTTKQEQHVIADAQARILGVGAQQYTEGDRQKFETMPLADLVEYAREETLDLVNYGAMVTLRIERLAEMVKVAEARLSNQVYRASSEVVTTDSQGVVCVRMLTTGGTPALRPGDRPNLEWSPAWHNQAVESAEAPEEQ